MRRVPVFLACLALFGCPEEEQAQSGFLERPSGLAYLESDGTADLFIADSEANGVRVLQFERGNDFGRFASASNPLLPLTIETPGFPTALAVDASSRRLYVLAPEAQAVHVVDVTPLPFGGSVVGSGRYQVLDSIDLMTVSDLTGPNAVPVDVAFVPGETSGHLVVLFDRGVDDGALVDLQVSVEEGLVTVVGTSSRSVGPVSRTIAVHTSDIETSATALLVASATGADALTVISIDGDRLGAPRRLSTGGPLRSVFSMSSRQVIGLRADRAAAVVYEGMGGAIERSTRLIEHPAENASAPADPDRAGRIDLSLGLPVVGVAADLGTIPSAIGPSSSAVPAAAIIHQNAQMTFLVGDPVEIGVRPVDVFLVDQLRSGPPVTLTGCEATEAPSTCAAREERLADATRRTACDAAVIGAPLVRSRAIKAEYRGNLVEGQGILRAIDGDRQFTLEGADGLFDDGGLIAGDRADLQFHVSALCGGLVRELTLTASVSGVGSDSIELDGDLAEAYCGDLVAGGTVAVARFELYPDDEVIVVSETAAEGPGRVLERAPVDGRTAVLSDALRTTLTASSGWACGVQAPAVACSSDDDCGGGLCGDSSLLVCGDVCDTSACVPTALSCDFVGTQRICDGLLFDVRGTRINRHLPSIVTQRTDFRASAPSDAVFSPLRDSWLSTYPGARGISEVRVTTGGLENIVYR